jgi:glycosyltransferase involved in cell wall biosynthesis
MLGTRYEVRMSLLPTRVYSPSSRPLISVIIPTVSRPGLLEAALASVAAQDVHGEVEVIVINDGGGPVDSIVHAWNKKMTIKLLEVDQRRGPATARNLGIQVADGDYIAFLDDDDLFLSGHLAAGCVPLDSGDGDFVYLGAVVYDRRLNSLPMNLAEFKVKAYPYDHRFLLVANFLHTGSIIVRNFKNTPVRFDESLNVCEDWDLWLALTTVLEYRVVFIDKITSIYHQLPNVAGLVSGAQLSSPSKFSLAREYIDAKWLSRDPLVLSYREWMRAVERLRSDLIARNRRMPNLLFDWILEYLHERISHGKPANYADISQFFVRTELE